MTSDPILREVYKAKDKLAKRYAGDVHGLFEHLRELEKEYPERLVCPPLKKSAPAKRRAAKGKTAE